MGRAVAAAIVIAAIGAALVLGLMRRDRGPSDRCGPGFVADGARCRTVDARGCPSPLVATPAGCDAPRVVVAVPAAAIAVGPSDWEAEGRVLPRSIRVQAFRIDAFEVTRGRLGLEGDAGRAASAVPRDEAAAFCARQGGRLPTEDEWIVAATSAMNPPARYPWGDTGAVCRRAAWGLQSACARDGDGPDTVGAHPSGDSPPRTARPRRQRRRVGLRGDAPLGSAGPHGHLVKGGSWRDTQASELRIWATRPVPLDARDPTVGFRCVYPP